MFKIKGAWPITRAEKLQVSVFLPNDLSLDDWYAGVYALPTVWPDVSMMGASNLRRVVGYDFHHIRKKYDVPSMGQYPPTVTITTAASGNQGAWLVPACRKRREALYQQI